MNQFALTNRAASRQDELLAEIRREIIAGAWGPGSQLPTRLELVERCQVSSRTLQPVLSRLIADGFLQADRRNGTFVVDHPPHLNHYALTFPASPHESDFSLHWQALIKAADRHFASGPQSCTSYYALERTAETNEYDKLLYDVLSKRLAGVFFSSPPFHLYDTPILDDTPLPRIALTAAPDDQRGIAAIAYDLDSFVHKALQYLHDRGRRRLALFLHGGAGRGAAMEPGSVIRRVAGEYDFELPDHAVLGAARNAAELTAHAVQLLMRQPVAERPDALVITDDHILVDVANGLVEAGMDAAAIDVVGHANFPLLPVTPMPVWHVGNDMSAVIRTAVDYIDACRRGRRPATFYRLPAKSENEVDEIQRIEISEIQL